MIEELRKIGITLTYIASIKDQAAWVSYIYKGAVETEIPEEAKKMMKRETQESRGQWQRIAERVASEFDTKPSMNMYKERLFKEDFSAKNAYNQVQFGKKKNKLKKALKKLNKEQEKEDSLINGDLEDYQFVNLLEEAMTESGIIL